MRLLVPILCVLAGVAIGAATTYGATREKWYRLGQNDGHISGLNTAMQTFAPYATKSAPPQRADASINVKSSTLSLLQTPDGARLYIQE